MWPFVDGQNDVLHHAMEQDGTVNTDKPMWTVMTTHEGVVITCFFFNPLAGLNPTMYGERISV